MFNAGRSCLLERRIMFRSPTPFARLARISSLSFAVLLAAATAAPIQAAVVSNSNRQPRLNAEWQFSAVATPENPSEETIRVPIWIPGFDSEEPSWPQLLFDPSSGLALSCSTPHALKVTARESWQEKHFLLHNVGQLRSGLRAVEFSCGRILRALPWNSQPAGTVRMQSARPMI